MTRNGTIMAIGLCLVLAIVAGLYVAHWLGAQLPWGAE